jgi:hypothetical protein
MTQINLSNSKKKDHELVLDLKSRIRTLDRKFTKPKEASVVLREKQMEAIEKFHGVYKYNGSISFSEALKPKDQKISSYKLYGWTLHISIIKRD